jgi:hypothetical protein
VKEAVKKVIKECIKNEYIIKVYYNTTVAKSNIVKLDPNQNLMIEMMNYWDRRIEIFIMCLLLLVCLTLSI